MPIKKATDGIFFNTPGIFFRHPEYKYSDKGIYFPIKCFCHFQVLASVSSIGTWACQPNS